MFPPNFLPPPMFQPHPLSQTLSISQRPHFLGRIHPPVPHPAPHLTMQQEKPSVATPSSILTQQMLTTALSAADAAADIIRPLFRKPLEPQYKSDHTPVTIADKQAEAAMRAVIRSAFPTHAILGEEQGQDTDHLEFGYVWVLDPIDGTKAFMAGRPTFGTLIALVHDGVPVLGVIDQCISKERWVGTLHGTTLNGERVGVGGAATSVENCVVHATTPEMFTGVDVLAFERVKKVAKGVAYGSDCYAYALLASGCVEVVVEADLKVWDYMALVPIVKGAGGCMTDWYGRELGIVSDGRVVATAGEDLQRQVVGLLGGEEMDREMMAAGGVVSEPLAVAGTEDNGLPLDPGPGRLQSMTGYGERMEVEGDIEVLATLRGVNSRYCDVQVKGPKALSAYDSELTAIVRRRARRGKLILGIEVTVGGAKNGRGMTVEVDRVAASRVKKLLDEVAEAAGVKAEATLSEVLSFSEVLVRKEAGLMGEEVVNVVKRAVVGALDDFEVTRRREGAVLEKDVLGRTRKIRDVLNEIGKRAGRRVEDEKKRLEKLTREIAAGLDRQRLEMEITLFADRVDITEELVRLESHNQMFEMTVFGAHEPVGQRLLFFLQEMNREVTTIATKACDSAVSHLAVLIKEEIEKIREQCQNVR